MRWDWQMIVAWSLAVFGPWALLLGALYASGVWW